MIACAGGKDIETRGLEMGIINEKIDQAVQILREKNIDMWLTFARETSTTPDPALDLLLGTHVTWPSAFIITRSGKKTAIVGTLDMQNIRDHAPYEVIGYRDAIQPDLLKVLEETDPKQIAINTSKNDVTADGLTHGMYEMLLDMLKESPFAARLQSSQSVVAALRGRKSAAELACIRAAVEETLKIFNAVSGMVKTGMTEYDVAEFIRMQMSEKGLEAAWDPESCPAVFTGPDSAGAHAMPTGREIEPGHIMNIDFGVRVRGYVSDLQRTWYFLKEGNTEAPDCVRRGFNVIRDAIRRAADVLKPGVEGREVDAAARQYIVDAGYEEYPHALGHQVGRKAHDGSTLLCPEWQRYGDLPFSRVEAGQVFTLEPRLTVPGYGVATIEEIVVVREDGVEFLSDPQENIWLVT